jgi:LacI family transcriptional regulator
MSDVAAGARSRQKAAELLAERLASDDSPPRRVVMPTALIVRGSGEVKP